MPVLLKRTLATGPDAMVEALMGDPPGDLPITLPPEVLDWFTRLRRLEGIPLEWLLPDPERDLPLDSFRLFYLDREWLVRLAEGVLAAGAAGVQDLGVLELLARTVRRVTLKGVSNRWTGLLLRSSVVRHYPTMQIEAWNEEEEGTKPLAQHVRRLSEDVLLVIFEGEAQRIELHEPPVATRFCVEMTSGKKQWNGVSYERKKFTLEEQRPLPKDGIDADGYLDVDTLLSHWDAPEGYTTSPAAFALRFQDTPFTLILGKRA